MNRREILKSLSLGTAAFYGLSSTVRAEIEKIAFETTQSEAISGARLLFNENPFGPSDAAKKAIADNLSFGNRYPWDEYATLQEMIAKEEGIQKENILIGAGSTEFLILCGMYYGLKGGKILSCQPSYSTLTAYIENFKAQNDSVPLDKNYKTDLTGLTKAMKPDTSLVYICNPNNPTGTSCDTVKLKSFCEFASKSVPVLVDEAYIEFLENHKQASMVKQVRKGNNVIVLKTFSKIYGLAGMRIGYCIAPQNIINELKKFYSNLSSVSVYSLRAAIAAYGDTQFVDFSRKKLASSRQFTESSLVNLGYKDYIPSDTNFMLFPIRMAGEQFKKEMLQRNVSIKVWQFDNKHWCRVSMGTADEMKQFATALKQIG